MIAKILPNTPCLLHQNLKCHKCNRGKRIGMHAGLEYDDNITLSPFKFAARLPEIKAQNAFNCAKRSVQKGWSVYPLVKSRDELRTATFSFLRVPLWLRKHTAIKRQLDRQKNRQCQDGTYKPLKKITTEKLREMNGLKMGPKDFLFPAPKILTRISHLLNHTVLHPKYRWLIKK